MKQRILAVLLVLVAIFALSACGTNTTKIIYTSPPVMQTISIPESSLTPEGAKPQAPPPVNKQPSFSTVPLHISSSGLLLIERFEGYSRCAYWDTYGKIYTAGFGQTKGIYAGFCFKSVSSATANLKYSVESEYEWAIRALGVPFNQNQWNALCSFAYNLGAGIFTGSLRYDLQHRQFRAATAIMLSYDHAGGIELAGLKIRRVDEVDLFNTPVHKSKPKPKPKPLTRVQQAAKLTAVNKLLAPHTSTNRRGHNCANPPYKHAYPSAKYNEACAQWTRERKSLQHSLKEKK